MGQPASFEEIRGRSTADLLGLSDPLEHVFALTLNYLQMLLYGSGISRNPPSAPTEAWREGNYLLKI